MNVTEEREASPGPASAADQSPIAKWSERQLGALHRMLHLLGRRLSQGIVAGLLCGTLLYAASDFAFAQGAAQIQPQAETIDQKAQRLQRELEASQTSLRAAQASLQSSQEALQAALYAPTLRATVILMSFGIVAVVTVILFFYMVRLRDQLAKSTEPETRRLFPHMALGLPDGSIRAGLAILIVLGSLLSLMGAVFPELSIKTPEALTGVFGTILGFYFGRGGGAETAEASRALQTAATAGAAAQQKVEQAQQLTQQVEKELADSQQRQAATAGANAPGLLAAAAALVDSVPAPLKTRLGDALATARKTIEDAQASRDLEKVTAAMNSFKNSGPVAGLVADLGSALASLVPAGTTVAALRALADTTARLQPIVAQRWTARLMNMPYRHDLFTPAIDVNYARALLAKVANAPALLEFLKANRPNATADGFPPLNEVEFVKLALSEPAADTIASLWAKTPPPDGWQDTIATLQRRALEMQLEKDIPPDLMQAYGGFTAFFTSLDAVQANENGMRALDAFVSLVGAARAGGVALSDLLPA